MSSYTEISDAERLVLLREKRARIVELRAMLRDQLQDHQKPPDLDWLIWVLLAGRGAGKTYGGMFWLNDELSNNPGTRARIIAPTQSDGVASCVEGPNGLLTLSHGMARFNPSHASGANVSYPNGSKVWIVGTPTPQAVDRLRALTNIEIDVFEEFFANPQAQAAWDQAELSRRKGRRLCVVTSTPRPHKIHKEWAKDPDVVITRAKTSDNKKNDPKWVARQIRKYKGTRLYKQEILGEVIDDVEGALWKQSDIDRSTYEGDRDELIERLEKIIVGVDPSSGPGTCGIVVVGIDEDGHIYVLDDYSISDATPRQWALRLAQASADYGDALVVAEKNNGHRMVAEVVLNVTPDLPLDTVWASESKKARAEPISVLWEAEYQSAHFVPMPDDSERDFVKLQDELTSWVPGPTGAGQFSPDHLDALVWAATKLKEGTGHLEATFPTSNEQPDLPNSFGGALRGGY